MRVWETTRRIVKERYEQQGIRQGFLARKCGFTEKDFSLIVNGKKPITDEVIDKLCVGLGVAPNELLGWTDTA
ncbi:MAG: helix-turn-helix domain-containing protein [Treponema sp.]|nr:helix-turn-helix domain-containing protein [Treponema sp.]